MKTDKEKALEPAEVGVDVGSGTDSTVAHQRAAAEVPQAAAPRPQVPTPGRVVQYRLTEADVQAINRRRTTGDSISYRAGIAQWPAGAQAHIGNVVHSGDIFPMMIVRVWGHTADAAVNGQVFLDGNDSLWVTSVSVGDAVGSWSWPVLTR